MDVDRRENHVDYEKWKNGAASIWKPALQREILFARVAKHELTDGSETAVEGLEGSNLPS